MNVVSNDGTRVPAPRRPRSAAPAITEFGRKGTSSDARNNRAREDAEEMSRLKKQGLFEKAAVAATQARGLPEYTERDRQNFERLQRV